MWLQSVLHKQSFLGRKEGIQNQPGSFCEAMASVEEPVRAHMAPVRSFTSTDTQEIEESILLWGKDLQEGPAVLQFPDRKCGRLV